MRSCAAAAVRAVVLSTFVAWAAGFAVEEQPTTTGLTEKVEKRLVQLDVAVEGDRDAILRLTAKDISVDVGGHEVQGLIVDPLCGDSARPTPSPTEQEAPAGHSARPRVTVVLFFDQPHLTVLGRNRSLEASRELITRLIVNGAQASIVSNGKGVETLVPMTDNPERLLEGLERFRNNFAQMEAYADGESMREQQVLQAYRDDPLCPDSCECPCPPWLALTYAEEELRIARTSAARLAIAVDTLAEVPAPKVLVYFGDTLRQYAGLHYLKVIKCPDCQEPFLRIVPPAEMTPSAAFAFDAVINAALARGVHFFTIEAHGLLAYRRGLESMRNRQAQGALGALAAETGGEAFFGGASTRFIATRIDALTSCRLLLSFPPGELPVDKTMSVTVVVSVPKVKIRSQGLIVVPSPASIQQSRLLAAFVNPAASDDKSLRALLIPRGGDGKNWDASIQLRLRPTGIPDNSAELGASIVRHDKVTDQFASSIAARSGTREMVLEKTLEIPPGEFAVVAVALDKKRGDIGSTRITADWPNPAKSTAAIAPIAVLQVGPAAMTKDGVVGSSGSLARDVDEMLDPSSGVSLLSVACRGGKTRGPVVIERWLEDGSRDEFAPMTITETGGACLQTLDTARAGRLRPGAVDYHIVARIGDEIVAQQRRTLLVGTRP
jgi:VWFA-related protein